MSNLLKTYGLSEHFIKQALVYSHLNIGRIISEYKNLYKVITDEGELLAEISGKFRHESQSLSNFPAVGDFVMLDRTNNNQGNAIIHLVLDRKSVFSRKAVGLNNESQIIASNIDSVFICMSVNYDFNIRRLERYLSSVWESGAVPVVVLTKSDLCDCLEEKIIDVQAIAFGVDIVSVSSLREDSYLPLLNYVEEGKTVAFTGSSGVGKSTLINCLAGKTLAQTNEIRNNEKGKHTTTRRDLFVLPHGGIVIDTPGMREFGLESADLSKSFSDIEELIVQCKFNDCSHTKEPGCAIQKSINSGDLSQERFDNFTKLKKELKYDSLNSRQIETEKINTMFGGKSKYKEFMKAFKNNK